MKKIRTMFDMCELRISSKTPRPYIKVIEEEFLVWYKTEGRAETLASFVLSEQSCIKLLETKKDVEFLMNQLFNIEYVDKGIKEEVQYYRIGIMNDHQMIVVFSLEEVLDKEVLNVIQYYIK